MNKQEISLTGKYCIATATYQQNARLGEMGLYLVRNLLRQRAERVVVAPLVRVIVADDLNLLTPRLAQLRAILLDEHRRAF